jgi:hypothetical protein
MKSVVGTVSGLLVVAMAATQALAGPLDAGLGYIGKHTFGLIVKVPEPGTCMLLGAGLAGVAFCARKLKGRRKTE